MTKEAGNNENTRPPPGEKNPADAMTVKELIDRWPNLDGRFVRQLFLMETYWRSRAAIQESMLRNSAEGRVANFFLEMRKTLLPRDSLCERAAKKLWRIIGRKAKISATSNGHESTVPLVRHNGDAFVAESLPAETSVANHHPEPKLPDCLSRLAGCPLPFYLDAESTPCAVAKVGIVPHRVMAVSIPKAGTYLLAEVLAAFGCEWTKLHLAPDSVEDYRGRTFEEIRAGGSRSVIYAPLWQTSLLIRPGQFGVGHLDCDAENKRILAEFKKIFIYRELRDALISQMRFQVEASRRGEEVGGWKDLPDGPRRMEGFLADPAASSYMLSRIRKMSNWLGESDVYCLSFETLYGDRGAECQERTLRGLHEFLEVPIPLQNPRDSMAQVLGKPTRTWSGKRSAKQRYWDGRVEDQFRRLGGVELNAAFGYE
jgi:hypothetical protein